MMRQPKQPAHVRPPPPGSQCPPSFSPLHASLHSFGVMRARLSATLHANSAPQLQPGELLLSVCRGSACARCSSRTACSQARRTLSCWPLSIIHAMSLTIPPRHAVACNGRGKNHLSLPFAPAAGSSRTPSCTPGSPRPEACLKPLYQHASTPAVSTSTHFPPSPCPVGHAVCTLPDQRRGGVG